MNDEPAFYARQSASSVDQPEDRFSRLFEAAEHHGFNLALMIRFDRISRDSTVVQELLETLEKQRAKIITLGW
jgi:DNA invertase Pin-like site-specific DNA recombinase